MNLTRTQQLKAKLKSFVQSQEISNRPGKVNSAYLAKLQTEVREVVEMDKSQFEKSVKIKIQVNNQGDSLISIKVDHPDPSNLYRKT